MLNTLPSGSFSFRVDLGAHRQFRQIGVGFASLDLEFLGFGLTVVLPFGNMVYSFLESEEPAAVPCTALVTATAPNSW